MAGSGGVLNLPDGFPALPAGLEYIKVLGRGATGLVLLARQTSLDRLVAVKSIGSSPSADTIRRLEREARVLATLKHPSVVPVYVMRASGAHLFLVMEYLPGGDLDDQLKRNVLDGPRIRQVLFDVADALTFAAAAGVTHRDVKPSNILFRDNGQAVLGDFGLARMSQRTSDFHTVSGMITGTPRYLAPEQILNPDSADPRIDSYAFGILAYQLLTGNWPYSATTLAGILDSHVAQAPLPPDHWVPQFPAAVSQVLLQALDKDPARRATPSQVCAALGRVGAEPATRSATSESAALRPSTARPDLAPPDVLDPANRWIQPPIYLAPTRSVRSLVLAIGLAVIIGLIVGGYLLWSR